MRDVMLSIGRLLGFAAVACTIALSLPGIEAVRADDTGAKPSESPAPQATGAPDASFEGFTSYMQRRGRPAEVETAGPTCNASSPIQVEMAHRRAVAELKARLAADARAAAEAGGETPDIVVLNGRGYNYRGPNEPGPMPPGAAVR